MNIDELLAFECRCQMSYEAESSLTPGLIDTLSMPNDYSHPCIFKVNGNTTGECIESALLNILVIHSHAAKGNFDENLSLLKKKYNL